MWKSLLKAARYARKAHAGQTRLDGKTPYITHPMRVARRLWNAGHRDTSLLMAAYLHDTLEDTGVAFSDLLENFGGSVTYVVDGVTRKKGSTRTQYYRRVKTFGYAVMELKLADMDDNLNDLVNLPVGHPTRFKTALKSRLARKIFFS